MSLASVLLPIALVSNQVPSPTQTSVKAAEAAVRAADAAFAKAITDKSMDQTISFYDSQALTAGSVMFPGRGLQSFRAEWTAIFAIPGVRIERTVTNVAVTDSGDIAYSTGTWRAQFGGPEESGPFLTVWRKQSSGAWKIIVEAAWDLSVQVSPLK